MNINDIVEYGKSIGSIILLIISIIAVFKSIKQAVKANLIEQAVKFIEQAEGNAELTGPEKMDLVISWMKDIIPRLFKVVFTDDVLKDIAQNVFDDMKKYAKKYVEARTGASIDKINKIIIISQDDPDFEKKIEEFENTQQE